MVGEAFGSQIASQVGEPVACGELDYSVDVGVVTQQRRELLLGDHGEVAIRVSGSERPQQGCDEDEVPDGAEAHDEDAGRGGWRGHPEESRLRDASGATLVSGPAPRTLPEPSSAGLPVVSFRP